MAQGKHIGKVIIQVRPEDESKSVVKLVAHARSICDPRKSYVVTGGLGGFGLELAHWLVERGARNLVLTSRRGMTVVVSCGNYVRMLRCSMCSFIIEWPKQNYTWEKACK